MTKPSTLNLPGRLGDPSHTLATDTRAKPSMVSALSEFGFEQAAAPGPVTKDSPFTDIIEFLSAAEAGYNTVFESWFAGLPPIEQVSRRKVTIQGSDGNEIELHIHTPTEQTTALPAILHLHGGCMVLRDATDCANMHWRDSLAAEGLVVVGVEFRNAGGNRGHHAFPSGLNDCMSALRWLNANKAQLNTSKVVVSGDSGGGNLSLALTLKATQDECIDLIDGTYALCPYISNAWLDDDSELASLIENENYMLNATMLGAFARAYDPEHKNATNPLCWPLHANAAQLTDLPPHAISVNELDPLRDEGLAYFRKLQNAGVSSTCRTVNGTCHAGDVLLPKALPEDFSATLKDIARFAHGL